MSKNTLAKETINASQNALNFTDETYNDNNSRRSERSIKKKVDINLLIPNERNRFSMIKDDEYYELQTSIRKYGQTQPVIVKSQSDDGTYVILSGHRTTEILKAEGYDKVEIKTEPTVKTALDESSYLMGANMGTRQKKPYDFALSMRDISNDLNAETTKIEEDYFVENFGISRASYYNYMTLAKLPDILLNMGQDEILTRNDGIFLAKNYTFEENIAIAKEIEDKFTIGMTDKDKKMIITNFIGIKKKEVSKIIAGANENKPKEKIGKVASFSKKLDKIVSSFNFASYEMPKQKQKQENTLNMLNNTIEKLESLKNDIINDLNNK